MLETTGWVAGLLGIGFSFISCVIGSASCTESNSSTLSGDAGGRSVGGGSVVTGGVVGCGLRKGSLHKGGAGVIGEGGGGGVGDGCGGLANVGIGGGSAKMRGWVLDGVGIAGCVEGDLWFHSNMLNNIQ